MKLLRARRGESKVHHSNNLRLYCVREKERSNDLRDPCTSYAQEKLSNENTCTVLEIHGRLI